MSCVDEPLSLPSNCSPVAILKKDCDDMSNCESDLTSPSKNFKQDNPEEFNMENTHSIHITVKKLKEPYETNDYNFYNSNPPIDENKRFINLRTRDTRNHGIVKNHGFDKNVPTLQNKNKCGRTNRLNNSGIRNCDENYHLMNQNPCSKTSLQKVGSYTKYELPMVRRLIPNSRSRQCDAYKDTKSLPRHPHPQNALPNSSYNQYEEIPSNRSNNRSLAKKYPHRTITESPKIRPRQPRISANYKSFQNHEKRKYKRRTGRNRTLTACVSKNMNKGRNKTQNEIPCKSIDFNTMVNAGRRAKNHINLKKYVRMGRMGKICKMGKMRQGKPNILSNACIKKALKKTHSHSKHYTSFSKPPNNPSNPSMLSINQIVSHRPLAVASKNYSKAQKQYCNFMVNNSTIMIQKKNIYNNYIKSEKTRHHKQKSMNPKRISILHINHGEQF